MTSLIDKLLRRKVTREDLSYSEVQELLKRLDEATTIDAHYVSGLTNVYFNEATLREVIEFVEDEFKPKPTCYTTASRTTISRKEKEKHYVKLYQGIIKTRLGQREVWDAPFRTVTLKYFLRKSQGESQ